MDYEVFESRVMELLFKTDCKLSPQLAAFKIGCPVELARRYLEQMTTNDIVVMEVDDAGVIYFDLPGRPPPTHELLSWTPGEAPPTSHHASTALAHREPVTIQIQHAQPQYILVGGEKSAGLAAALGLFFGPLGMLYSTGLGALVMFLVNLVLVPLTLGLGLLVTAPVCAVWAAQAASEHNRKLLRPAHMAMLPTATAHIVTPPSQPTLPPPRDR
jgi:hypothetical protein